MKGSRLLAKRQKTCLAPAPLGCVCGDRIKHPPASPTWHRRKRTARHRLLAGGTGKQRIFDRLYYHHGTPPAQAARLLFLMGGKHYDKSWAKDNKNWSPWRGSWRSARTGSYDRGQRQSSSAFPSYDSQWLAADSIEVVAETRTKEPHPDGSVKAVQAAINQVRKADARVWRIQKEQRDKTQMWETYERKLRASFLQEKKKHAEAMTKLAGELVEAATELFPSWRLWTQTGTS